MVQSITLKKIGGSIAAVIPKDVLLRQKLAVNDEVFVIETPDGILLTATDPATKAAMVAYEEGARENRAAMAALATL
ncbi:MAG: AbrB/MazE/SpoVT family DNA-binding domain-containing protein [Gemmatimonadaceae bacterium]